MRNNLLCRRFSTLDAPQSIHFGHKPDGKYLDKIKQIYIQSKNIAQWHIENRQGWLGTAISMACTIEAPVIIRFQRCEKCFSQFLFGNVEYFRCHIEYASSDGESTSKAQQPTYTHTQRNDFSIKLPKTPVTSSLTC